MRTNLKLKDILPNHYINIQVRTYTSFDEDIFFGSCHWSGTKLISDDGDDYSIDDEILKYEFSKDGKQLTYWFKSEWI